MCFDCLNNLQILRLEKFDQIEKCHFCEKFIEQIFSKKKSIYSLLQCSKCQNRFHSKCDGYLNEDPEIISHMKNFSLNIICSKCDFDEREKIRKTLNEYKLQTMKAIESNLFSTFEMIITDENQLNQIQIYFSKLQSSNLQTFLNDLLLIIRRLLNHN